MIEGRDFAAASTVGGRDQQEDDWGTHADPPALEPRPHLLAVVADGMGGLPGGAQASELVVRAFLDSYLAISRSARARLRHALAHANREVGIAVEEGRGPDGMGCTLVAALFFQDRCEWLSVGDSSILHCRNDKLERVNPLHVFANNLDEQTRRGEISAEEAKRHPDRHALTSAVQGTFLEEVAQGELLLAAGDVVMLATDGLSTLSDSEIVSTCMKHATGGADAVARTLIARTEGKRRDRQDNATVVVVRHIADNTAIDPMGRDVRTAPGMDDCDQTEFDVAEPAKPTNADSQAFSATEVETPVDAGDRDAAVTANARSFGSILNSPFKRYATAFLLGVVSTALVFVSLF